MYRFLVIACESDLTVLYDQPVEMHHWLNLIRTLASSPSVTIETFVFINKGQQAVTVFSHLGWLKRLFSFFFFTWGCFAWEHMMKSESRITGCGPEEAASTCTLRWMSGVYFLWALFYTGWLHLLAVSISSTVMHSMCQCHWSLKHKNDLYVWMHPLAAKHKMFIGWKSQLSIEQH